MSKYLMLLFEDEQFYAEASPETLSEVLAAHRRFAEQVPGLGAKILGGDGLQPTATATTVRGDVVTDGPFIETKEALGGYYLIEADDLDQALQVAKLCPAFGHGGIEVRPVMEYNG